MTRIKHDEPLLKIVGERLRLLREASGLKRDNILEEVDVSASNLWMMECGRKHTNFVVIQRLCMIYSISIDLLINGSDNEFVIKIKEMCGETE